MGGGLRDMEVSLERLEFGDYFWIGVNFISKNFFVVKNGQIVINKAAISPNWHHYYPAVGVTKAS